MDPLITAMAEANRAGFDVRTTYTKSLGYTVSLCSWIIIAGEATDRLKNDPIVVTRPDLTDALGNALAIVGVEIGIDRAAKERKLAE